MSKPVSPKPLRKVAAICAYSQDDPPLRNPIIGIAVCCARAASGYATHRRTAQQIFPVPEETLAIEHSDFPKHWPRIGGMDFGWDHPFAAVELVWDRDTDTVYVTKSYRVREMTAVIHAAALRLWGKNLPWAWPRDGRRETAPASRWPISTRRKASRCSACTPNSTMARCRSRPVSRTC